MDTNLGGTDFRLLLIDAGIVLLHGPDFDHCVECIGVRGKGLRDEERVEEDVIKRRRELRKKEKKK